MKIKDINFIVTDVETTGSKKDIDRVIDIACIVVRNGLIVDEFSSLLNPRRHISKLISKITGINDEMVEDAPYSEDIMPVIAKYCNMPDAIFVGHFVTFDYNFVNIEMKRSGLEPIEMPTLDTLKLAQKIIPDGTKKNVGAMSKYYKIPVVNRHRALGDAKATAYSLIEMLRELEDRYLIGDNEELMRFQNNKTYQIKSRLKKIESIKPQLRDLPKSPGVFYFLDENDRVIYLSKAANIKNEVEQYFRRSRVMSKTIPQIVSKTEKVKWVETNTELSAILLENSERQELKPDFNFFRSNDQIYSFIKITREKYPSIFRTGIVKDDDADYIGPFANRFLIDNIILNVHKYFKIRKCKGKFPDNAECIYGHLENCPKPCINNISETSYHEEIGKAKQYILKGCEAELVNSINVLSKQMKFESATYLRNQLFDLKNVKLNPATSDNTLFNSSFISIIPGKTSNEMSIHFIKSGLLKSDMTVSAETKQEDIYDAIVESYADIEEKVNYSRPETEECKLIKNYIGRGNGDVNIIDVPPGSALLDIYDECITFLDNFFVK